MSTLAEVEQAVDALPPQEQETLLQHLLVRKNSDNARVAPTADAELSRRQDWLAELRRLRERNATGRVGAPLQEVMDELRGDSN